MNYIERKECAVGHVDDLETIYSFRDFPVFMGCSSEPAGLDLKADMVWGISRSSGLIQLRRLLPLNVLYPASHGSGSVGNSWKEHHRAFASFIERLNPGSVLEIGGAHGVLAKEYGERQSIPWTIIEPNPAPVEGTPARFIKGFFDETFSPPESFDAVVHSHVFEHTYYPDAFMDTISHIMSEGKHLVFSIPNMQVMLERKFTNCVNFEHTMLLTEPYVEHLLAKHAFRIVAKDYFRDDHSIFYAAAKDRTTRPIELRPGLYASNKRLYLDYIEYHERLVTKLNEAMRSTNKPVYLFGAHVFSQYLLSFGLKEEKIICLLDNDEKKHNRRLYGTSLRVQSPWILKDVKNPVVVLRAGVFNSEIKANILSTINPDVEFWE